MPLWSLLKEWICLLPLTQWVTLEVSLSPFPLVLLWPVGLTLKPEGKLLYLSVVVELEGWA